MREKKPALLITFASTTQALSMEAQCRKADMPGRLIPLPGFISAGCGLCWKTSLLDQEQWIGFLLKEHLTYEKIGEFLMP